MNCPRCGLINPPGASRCDCGHDFASGQLTPALPPAGPFVSAHGPARWVMYLLTLCVVIDLVGLVSSFLQLGMISGIIAGNTFSPGELEANDQRQQAVGTLQILVFVVCGILFLRWLRRAYGNLPAFGVVPRFTRNWAAGWFFVPVMSLFRPYQVLKELWVGSRAGHTAVVGWWWAFYLLTSSIGMRSFATSGSARTPSDFLTATWLAIAADVTGVEAGLLAIGVVRGIDSGQQIITRKL